MIRRGLLFVFTIFLSTILYAQKSVNVDNLKFRFEYRAVPNLRTDPPFFYYSINLDLDKYMQGVVTLEEVQNKLVIEGQRYTAKPKSGDALVSLMFRNIKFTEPVLKEYVDERKDKQGRVVQKDYSYTIILEYAYDAAIDLHRNGALLKHYEMKNTYSKHTFESPVIKDRGMVWEYWAKNKDALLRDKLRADLLHAASRSTGRPTWDFGFPSSHSNEVIKTINEKKHPENLKFRQASSSLKKFLEKMTSTIPMKEEDVASLIKYYEGVVNRYTNPSSKADQRLRYAAYYNLCKIYLYLDQPEKVGKYADLILENGYDKKDSEKLHKAADELLQTFRYFDIWTRHFDPNIYFED